MLFYRGQEAQIIKHDQVPHPVCWQHQYITSNSPQHHSDQQNHQNKKGVEIVR